MTPAEQIAADMRALPVETRKAVRPALHAAGQVIVVDAKRRAGWSARIPGTIRTTTSFRFEREGVDVKAGNASTPHARLYEDVARKGYFRHPVYGHRDRWVSQVTRSFLFPAAQANEAAATAAVTQALSTAAAAIGFH